MKNVFLVGMPSSGKSTLGRRLARALNYRFVDLDKLIVKDQNKTIPQIFSTHGEDYFREVERRVLQEIGPEQATVIATGGGAPCFFDNMQFIKNNGVSVFLDVEPSELAARIIHHNRDDRPLLSGVTDLETELKAKLAGRFPFYAQADITISNKTSIQEIIELINQHA
ncbi:shikimate kinase [Persicitalea jodogahamensis]|uniref:Shikimate kinase n=1 Tax=Persicitalea jodogahamensis TaxID=402147 RepID=A0A8J3DBQ0_9BACT|nr:shikimate kinase [Persicitalea jodogahamensis]GHB80431.1 shikimate kinase [Persicitalea jodogahamensis]